MTVIILPESLPVPRCAVCRSNPVAYLTVEIGGGSVQAVCAACDAPAPGRARSARIGEFAVLARTLETA